MLMPEMLNSITTILVIDDDIELATVFCDALALNGFATLKATTGQKGIHLAELHRPQLIICDIGLPDVDGYGVLKSLRSHPPTATIPIIMLTSHGVSHTFRHTMEQGADDYLTKPARITQIADALARHLKE